MASLDRCPPPKVRQQQKIRDSSKGPGQHQSEPNRSNRLTKEVAPPPDPHCCVDEEEDEEEVELLLWLLAPLPPGASQRLAPKSPSLMVPVEGEESERGT